jgi:hypothetical protein
MTSVLDELSATLERHYDLRHRPLSWIARVLTTPDIASDAMIIVRNYEGAVAGYHYTRNTPSSRGALASDRSQRSSAPKARRARF